MKNSNSKSLDKAAEAYFENTTFRALINAIPYVGGSLDVLLSSKGKKIVEGRIVAFVEQLRKDVGDLKEDAIDRTFLESEEWFDLVIKTIEHSSRTRDVEKMKLYSKILRAAVIKRDRKENDPEEYLNVLAELSPREIILAKAIYAQQSDRPIVSLTEPRKSENELQWAERKGWQKLSDETGIDKNDLPFLLKRLERTGLIREITGTYLDYEGGVYAITDVFRKLMGYLAAKP